MNSVTDRQLYGGLIATTTGSTTSCIMMDYDAVAAATTTMTKLTHP